MAALELRLNTTDEANQRLYNKWSTVEERFQHLEGHFQGEIRALHALHRAMEKRIEMVSLSTFDSCDDILVIEE